MVNKIGVTILLVLVLAVGMVLPVIAAEGNETPPIVVEASVVPSEIYFPVEGSVFFDEGSYQISWTCSAGEYGIPLVSIGLIPSDGNTSPLNAEWVVIREEAPVEESYMWYISPNINSGEYVLIVVLDYPGMLGTYYQEIIYSDSFFVINDGIDQTAPVPPSPI